MRILLFVLLLFSLQDTPTLKLEKESEDKALGFKLRLPEGATLIPIRKILNREHRDLVWYEDQVLRSWLVRGDGKKVMNRMRIFLAQIRFPLRPDDPTPVAEWNTEKKTAWVEAFSGMSVNGASFKHKMKGRLTSEGFRLRSETHFGLGFLYRYRDDTRLLLYKAPTGWEVESTERSMRSSASTYRAFRPKKVRDKVHSIPWKKTKKNKATARVESGLKGMDDWWTLTTDRFVIAGNLEASSQKKLIASLADDLEKLDAAFQHLFPPKKKTKTASVVRIFNSAEGFHAYFSERPPMKLHGGIQGLWIPAYDELVLFHNPGKTRPTLYHEAFHQYIHYAMGELSLPRWFDEGTGDFFGGAQITGDGIVIRENPTRKNVITRIVNGEFKRRYKWDRPSLKTLISMTREEFYRDTKWIVFRYAMCWSLIYYLRKGVDEDSPRHGVLDRYLDRLFLGDSNEQALKIAFDGVDMARLEKDWESFWLSPDARRRGPSHRTT